MSSFIISPEAYNVLVYLHMIPSPNFLNHLYISRSLLDEKRRNKESPEEVAWFRFSFPNINGTFILRTVLPEDTKYMVEIEVREILKNEDFSKVAHWVVEYTEVFKSLVSKTPA